MLERILTRFLSHPGCGFLPCDNSLLGSLVQPFKEGFRLASSAASSASHFLCLSGSTSKTLSWTGIIVRGCRPCSSNNFRRQASLQTNSSAVRAAARGSGRSIKLASSGQVAGKLQDEHLQFKKGHQNFQGVGLPRRHPIHPSSFPQCSVSRARPEVQKDQSISYHPF